MDGAQSLIRNGLAQSDLDMNGFRITNADLSNFPPSGIPPTVNPPAHNWLRTWDAPSLSWGYSRPVFSDIGEQLTTPQMRNITQVGRVRVGTWQADVLTPLFVPTLDQIRLPVGNVDLNGNRVTNLADPIDETDAVNRRFMDFLLQGLQVKEAVRLATTEPISTATLTRPVDGVDLEAGDRILVKDQVNPAQNGIWIAATGPWSRSDDCNTADEIERAYCTVLEGDTNTGSSWVQVLEVSNISTDPKSFLIFSSAPSMIAGDGLVKVGNTLNIGEGTGIQVNADSIQIDPGWTGQNTLITLGIVTTGEWQGEVINPAFGGTGEANDPLNTLLLGCPVRVDVVSPAPSPSLQFIVNHTSSVTVPDLGVLATQDGIETFINKRIQKRSTKITTSAQPNIDTDAVDAAYVTALATNITDMSANLIGAPTDSQELEIWFKDNGVSRGIAWGASFVAPDELSLPIATDIGFWTYTRFVHSVELAKWVLTDALTLIA